MDEYKTRVQEISELEKKPSAASFPNVRSSYEKLLSRFPHLEGFWIRWAHTEFRLQRTPEAAIAVFQKALATLNLGNSLLLWVSYLRFLIHVCYTEHTKPQHVHELFEQASQSIGYHFLSHEFWDLYLEFHPEPVSLLVHIIDDLTIHQFAKFYAKLVALLETRTDLSSFRELMPFEVQNTELKIEELPQVRAVVLSKLKLKYELHLRRVTLVLPYEQKLSNPFFVPSTSPSSTSVDVLNWIEYINNSETPLQLYNRALIPCAQDPKMWLSYIRYHHSRTDSDNKSIRDSYMVPIALKLVPVLLHFALWLELQGDIEEAHKTYITAEEQPGDNTGVIVQFSQFLNRTSGVEAARDHINTALNKDAANSILRSQLVSLAHEANSRVSIPEIPTVDRIVNQN